MFRILIPALAALALLALPAGAGAEVIEIGATENRPAPSCPENCAAVSRTTGYQVKVGPRRGVFAVPQDGRIVAWSITLGTPGRSQVGFFRERLGGAASAGLAVLRTGRRLSVRTLAVSPVERLEPFFGTTVQFPLARTLPVRRGNVIGLNVPTWAPGLVTAGLGRDTSWRAARARGNCRDTSTPATQRPQQLTRFRCLYTGAQLTFTATLVTTPRPQPQRR